MLVNNEVGTIQPVADFAAAAHAKNSLLLCDAVQGYSRVAIPDGPDLIALSAHKIHGPKGIGALWVRDGIDLKPLMLGGAQEQGMRSGTVRSEEHTSELQSLMRNSYAVFCLKKKKKAVST